MALLVPAGVPVLLGWGLSQLSPAWDMRYLAVVLAPLLAAVAVGLVAARRWGAVALAVIVALWLPGAARPTGVSDAWQLARAARPLLRAGDLVVSTPIGQVPLLAYYLPAGLRYASPFGLQRDPRVVDWRDAARHLARTSTRAQLLPLLARAPAGSRVLLVTPVRWDARSRHTALGRRERRRSAEYERALARDRRFERVAAVPLGRLPADGLRGVIFRKR